MSRGSRQPPQLLNPSLIRFKPPQGGSVGSVAQTPLGVGTTSTLLLDTNLLNLEITNPPLYDGKCLLTKSHVSDIHGSRFTPLSGARISSRFLFLARPSGSAL
eukprot:2378386-Prymnesium_polylepis.1